jgi:outer membrane scaffolding protein for murein synthesis (MipA/OmpV family)
MKKLNAAALCSALVLMCLPAGAQTPAPNPMPDGSGDMYAGLGVVSMPRYAGADQRRQRLLPVLQGQWSNGIFVSGMRAGLHLSSRPWIEFGPLVELDPGRDGGGSGAGVIGVDSLQGLNKDENAALVQDRALASGNRLAGLPSIARRLQGGAFVNLYLAPGVRLTSNALYGAGNDRNGATATFGLQAMALSPAPHHAVTLTGTVALANRHDNQAFFGIDSAQSALSGNPLYQAHGGWRDARLGVNWHWALAPSWLVVSNLEAVRQLGATRDSPLVTRPTGVSVSTALAFRF